MDKVREKKLDWNLHLKIALGAAQGLAYLHHDCSPRIIHRDVKSSNVLLDAYFEPHLTDFGIATSLCPTKSHTSTYIMGTIGYIDPEYARTSRLTEKSDVYSYGIVLLELLTGRKAVDNESNLHHLTLSKTASNAVMETVDPDITATCKDLLSFCFPGGLEVRAVERTIQGRDEAVYGEDCGFSSTRAGDDEVLRDLEQMEKESDLDDILNYRSSAEFEMQESLSRYSTHNHGRILPDITTEKPGSDEHNVKASVDVVTKHELCIFESKIEIHQISTTLFTKKHIQTRTKVRWI